VSGERRWPVVPLRADDAESPAVTLLIDRVLAIDPFFAPPPGLADLCAQVEGIRDAIAHIAEHDADLAHHLRACVRTGTFCSYQPPPSGGPGCDL
jgi:hypothetical protein